jgi:Tol biopolymer transport system component
MKWLNGCRMRLVLVEIVAALVINGSVKADFNFGEPMNLGPTVNSSNEDTAPSVSADGMMLFFSSDRPGGSGNIDIWISTQKTSERMPEGYWGTPINLGPVVNSAADEFYPEISTDGLSLYFADGLWWKWESDLNLRPGGFGRSDLWVTTRETTEDDWGIPVNLGPTINGSSYDSGPSISNDGLTLYFASSRPGGSGGNDLWMATRSTVSDPWDPPINLGTTVNSLAHDVEPDISADGLVLFFMSTRSGGYGNFDLWVTMRRTKDDAWEPPMNLGPMVNSSVMDVTPCLQADRSTLLFMSARIGGYGTTDLRDLWQVSIEPVVDLNSDGIVDSADIVIMVDHWGTDYSLCDIGPMPWGDGVVDVEDLIILAEHLFEEVP